MTEYSRPLAEAVYTARIEMDLSQEEVATYIDTNPRTVLNIENCNANPTMDTLYPLIRLLNIDPTGIFYPERGCEGISFRKITSLLSTCSESEIETLIPICESVLRAIRNNNNSIDLGSRNKPASN